MRAHTNTMDFNFTASGLCSVFVCCLYEWTYSKCIIGGKAGGREGRRSKGVTYSGGNPTAVAHSEGGHV